MRLVVNVSESKFAVDSLLDPLKIELIIITIYGFMNVKYRLNLTVCFLLI